MFFASRPKKRKGFCKAPQQCLNGMIYWPQDSKCYTLHTRGPCPKGKLIVIGKNRIAECKVNDLCFVYKLRCLLNQPLLTLLLHNFSVKMTMN